MILIWKLIILEVFILLNTLYDADRIENDKPIHHGWEALVRVAFMAGLALVFNLSLEAWKELLFFGFVFWQFDYTLNWARQKTRIKWYYLGDAFLDKILKGYGNRYWRLGLKIGLVIGSFIIVVL